MTERNDSFLSRISKGRGFRSLVSIVSGALLAGQLATARPSYGFTDMKMIDRKTTYTQVEEGDVMWQYVMDKHGLRGTEDTLIRQYLEDISNEQVELLDKYRDFVLSLGFTSADIYDLKDRATNVYEGYGNAIFGKIFPGDVILFNLKTMRENGVKPEIVIPGYTTLEPDTSGTDSLRTRVFGRDSTLVPEGVARTTGIDEINKQRRQGSVKYPFIATGILALVWYGLSSMDGPGSGYSESGGTGIDRGGKK